MPYIIENERKVLRPSIIRLAIKLAGLSINDNKLDGRVNYVVTCLIDSLYGNADYGSLNAALGVLEAVKQEFYRRVVAPYEQEKCKENGDVYI